MTISLGALIGWGLFLAMFWMAVGIVGTVYYFKRWRRKVLLVVETYKERAKAAERIMRQGVKPGPIEKG